jgi:PAS domain S-box-containing protein
MNNSYRPASRFPLSEVHWRPLFDRSPSFVAVLEGPEHRIAYGNPRYLALVGDRDVVGRTVAEALPEAIEQGYGELLDRVYRSGEPYTAESASYTSRDVHGNALARHVDFVYQPICNDEGAVQGILVQGADVTARVSAHALLERNARTFEQLIAGTPYGLYVVDADFRIAQASAAASHAFRSVRPLIGRDLGEALRTIWQEPFATQAIERFRHTLATGEPYHAPSTIEQRADVDAVEAYDWRIERILLPDGRYGVACYFYDLTAHENLQRRLQAREKELSDLADAMPQLVWTTFPDGRPASYNRQWYEYTGLAGDVALAPEGWQGTTHPEDLPRVATAWSHALQTGEPYESEHRLRRHDGTYRCHLVRATAQRDAFGVIDRWIGTCTDIEASRGTQHALQRHVDLLAAATAAAQLGIHEYDIPSGEIHWDARVRALWGVDARERITYERFIAAVHPDDKQAVEAAVHAALEPSGPRHYAAEYRVRNLVDGRERWVAATGQVTFEGGVPIRLVGTVQDITPQKLRDSRLAFIADLQDMLAREQSADRLMNVVCTRLTERLHLSHCILSEVDGSGETAAVMRDHHAAAFTDVARDHSLHDLFGPAAHAALRSAQHQLTHDTRDGGSTSLQQLEASGIRSMATLPYVAEERLRYLLSAAKSTPHLWSDEEVGLLGEVAARLYPRLEGARNAEALRRSEAALRRTQAIGRIGTMELDLEVDRARYSPEYLRLHGLPGDLAGESRKEWLARVHPEDRARAERDLDAVFTGQTQEYLSEYRVVWPADRSVHWILSRGEIEVDRHTGAPARMLVTQYEVTEQREAERAWRESEARFRAVQETSIDGFMLLTAVRDASGAIEDFQWEFVNEAAARIVGRSREWFSGRRLLEEMPGNRDAGLFDGYVRVVETGTPWSVEFGYGHEGLDLYLRLVATRVGDGFAVTFADLTQSRRADLRVRASEERLHVALEAARAGVFDWNLDTGELYWSKLHYQLLGLAHDAEQPSYELWRRHVHPEDLERVENALRESIESGRVYRAEYRVRGADGTDRVVQGQGIVSAHPGAERRMVGAIVDVTDTRVAEAAARANEQRFRIMADGVPALIWVTDAAGRIEFVNREYCTFLGVTVEAVQRDGWQPQVHADDLGDYTLAFMQALAGRRGFESRARVRHASGAWRCLQSTGVPRFSDRGNFLGMVGLSFDVTALVEGEARNREADRRKDEFLATLSHELRNPMAPVRNAAALLASPRLTPDQLQWAQQVIERQVTHMARLLDDLLDMSRITQAKLHLKRVAVRLTDVVDTAIEAARPLIDRKAHRLSIELPADPVVLDADPVRLAQVITNLLTNAAKYTDPGGTIALRGRVEGTRLVLSVRDSGIGIALDALENIFTMFSQVDGSLTRAEGGLGIGLALVKGLVELHGGSVAAASEGPGRGAEFTLRLPIPAARAEAAPAPSRAAAQRGLRVLVADDNTDAADTMAMVLQIAGHEVRTAHSGRAALNLAATFRPDVGLLDIGMPDMTGYEVAAAIREASWSTGMHLVALTGWGQEEDKRKAAASGFDRHLTKPVDVDVLIATVTELGSEATR